MPGHIIEAKECKIVGVVDDGDQENAVDIRMEEERIEQKEDNQEQDGEEEKEEEPVEELIDHVMFEWSNILGLGMGEVDANDDEGLEVIKEGKYIRRGRQEMSQTGHKSPPPPSSQACVARKCLWGSYL